MVSAGNRVVFDDSGSFIENKATGIKTGIKEESGRYILELTVEKGGLGDSGFVGLEDELI